MTLPLINHVAIALPDIEAALKFYRDALGLRLERVESVEQEGVKVAFMPLGDSEIELVQPTRDDTGIAKWLSKHGAGLHHVCIQVADVRAAMQRIAAHGAELINKEPVTRPDGTQYAFVHPKSAFGVLIELYQIKSDKPADPQKALIERTLNTLHLNIQIAQHMLGALPENRARTCRDGADGWNVTEIACHLRDYDEFFLARAQQIRDEDYPLLTIGAGNQEQIVLERNYAAQTLQPTLQQWQINRAALIAFFETLQPHEWNRAGRHAVRGYMSMLDVATAAVWHDANHFEQLMRIMRD